MQQSVSELTGTFSRFNAKCIDDHAYNQSTTKIKS